MYIIYNAHSLVPGLSLYATRSLTSLAQYQFGAPDDLQVISLLPGLVSVDFWFPPIPPIHIGSNYFLMCLFLKASIQPRHMALSSGKFHNKY